MVNLFKTFPTTDGQFVILCKDEDGLFSYTARIIDGEFELFMPESDNWFASDIDSFTDCEILYYVNETEDEADA